MLSLAMCHHPTEPPRRPAPAKPRATSDAPPGGGLGARLKPWIDVLHKLVTAAAALAALAKALL